MDPAIVLLGDHPLDRETIDAVVLGHRPIGLSEDARLRIDVAAEFVAEQARSGSAVYGVTTGFGANLHTIIDFEEAEQLQENLLISHACGVGEPFPTEVVRAMLLLRINALAHGYSGIRSSTLDTLVEMLNRGVHPIVPEFGSLGASGDLCPLAHMALPLLGFGSAEFETVVSDGADAMSRAGIDTLRLTFKEGLALLNGTQAMTALGLISCGRLRKLLNVADAACALSLDAVAGRSAAFDERVQLLRRRPGQVTSAKNILALVEGSQLVDATEGSIPGKREYVQDSYSLRCAPQVHGACRDVLDHVEQTLVGEANAVTDNPLVFADTEEMVSGGNFHGEPIAMALDYLKVSICEIASISERRSAKLVDQAFNEGLPAFLVYRPGLNSGHMIPQYVAAALVSECKVLAHPASVDSIPSSANVEDHVSMGCHAGRHALIMVGYAEQVLGIELMISAQALDLRKPLEPGRGCGSILECIRSVVPFMAEDRVLYHDIDAVVRLVRGAALHERLDPYLS
jgi:histidine ammonia-lyase